MPLSGGARRWLRAAPARGCGSAATCWGHRHWDQDRHRDPDRDCLAVRRADREHSAGTGQDPSRPVSSVSLFQPGRRSRRCYTRPEAAGFEARGSWSLPAFRSDAGAYAGGCGSAEGGDDAPPAGLSLNPGYDGRGWSTHPRSRNKEQAVGYRSQNVSSSRWGIRDMIPRWYLTRLTSPLTALLAHDWVSKSKLQPAVFPAAASPARVPAHVTHPLQLPDSWAPLGTGHCCPCPALCPKQPWRLPSTGSTRTRCWEGCTNVNSRETDSSAAVVKSELIRKAQCQAHGYLERSCQKGALLLTCRTPQSKWQQWHCFFTSLPHSSSTLLLANLFFPFKLNPVKSFKNGRCSGKLPLQRNREEDPTVRRLVWDRHDTNLQNWNYCFN